MKCNKMEYDRMKTLAEFLGVEEEELKQSSYNENLFEYGNQEYLVCTDEEADQEVKENILDSLWAFDTEFILSHSKIECISDRTEKAFRKMQMELCESANEIIKAIIEDLDEFVADAISADGRGHFLSSYDGTENKIEEFYIYRTN
jgi:hypothetical protein